MWCLCCEVSFFFFSCLTMTTTSNLGGWRKKEGRGGLVKRDENGLVVLVFFKCCGCK